MGQPTPNPWFDDANGLAAKIVGFVTGLVALVSLGQSLFRNGTIDTAALTVAITSVLSGLGAIATIMQARKTAFSAKTVLESPPDALKADARNLLTTK